MTERPQTLSNAGANENADSFRRLTFALVCLTMLAAPLIAWRGFGSYSPPKIALIEWMACGLLLRQIYGRLCGGKSATSIGPIDWAAALFFGSILFSAFFAKSRFLAMDALELFGAYAVFYVVASRAIARRNVETLALCALAPATVLAVHSLLQRAFQAPLAEAAHGSLPSSLLGNPVYLGGHMTLALPLALALGLKTRSNGKKAAFLALAAVMIGAVIGSGSRGALAGLLVEVVLFSAWAFLQRNQPKRKSTRAFAAVAVGLFAILAVASALTATRPPSERDNAVKRVLVESLDPKSLSMQERRVMWGVGGLMAADRMPFGVGLGNFEYFTPEYSLRYFADPANRPYAHAVHNKWVAHAHNELLNMAAEGGVVGIAGFLALVAALGWALMKLFARGGESFGPSAALAAGFACALAGVFTHAMFNFPLHVAPNGLLIFVFLGALAALAAGPQKENAPIPKSAASPFLAFFLIALWLACSWHFYSTLKSCVHFNRGMMAMHRGDLEKSQSELKRALLWRPGDGFAEYNLAQAMIREGIQQAEAPASQTGGPSNSDPAALATEALGHLKRAEKSFRAANIHYWRARALIILGDFEAAERETLFALDTNPEDLDFWRQLRFIAAKTGTNIESL